MPSRRDQITMTDNELRAFVAEQKIVSVATLGPRGRPHLMPLWYVADGLILRGWTYAKSQKAKNLERDPHATLQIEDGVLFGVSITFIEQDAPLGLAHAVLTAEPFIGDSPFVMYLGDNLLRDGVTDLVHTFRSEEPDALILLTPVNDPENYGVAELDGTNRVTRLVEKPPEPKTDLALVGVYMFTPLIHEAARAIKPSARGELEITDAIQHLVDTDRRVEPHIVEGWWKDTGRLDDMLEANRLILDTIATRVDGTLVDSDVHGRVIVEDGARLERCTVRGPAIIGAGARLT